jgi:hypothetical protein
VAWYQLQRCLVVAFKGLSKDLRVTRSGHVRLHTLTCGEDACWTLATGTGLLMSIKHKRNRLGTAAEMGEWHVSVFQNARAVHARLMHASDRGHIP